MLEENEFILSVLTTLVENVKASYNLTPIFYGEEARLIDTACMTLTTYMSEKIKEETPCLSSAC